MFSRIPHLFTSSLLALALAACHDEPAPPATQAAAPAAPASAAAPTAASAAYAQVAPVTVTAALARQVIGVLHQNWLVATQAMQQGATDFCGAAGSLDGARQGFAKAEEAFSALQAVMVGPLLENNLVWRVQFWPDKKNLVGRQVEQLLKVNPAPDVAVLEKASVVVQGLSAAEYILYDPGIDLAAQQTQSRYCPLLVSIAQRQQTLAGQVNTQLAVKGGLLDAFSHFPNERYSEPLEAITELLRVDVTALDSLKKKLGTPTGRSSKGRLQPMQAEYWRSDLGLASISATLNAGKDVWQGNGGQGVRDLLQGEAQKALAARLDAAFSDAQAKLAAVGTPLSLAKALQSEQGLAQLNALYDSLDRLHRLHQQELVQALGIALGFNANDGD